MMRGKLSLPILTGVLAILFTLAVLVAWNLMFTRYYALANRSPALADLGPGYWVALSVGDVLLVLVIIALVVFLVSSVRAVLELRRQDTFLDSVTHELKSPLASLRLCLETMELRRLEPAVQERFVRMMKEDVDRLAAFIEHVLEAGRLRHGEREISCEATAPGELARRCAEKIERRHGLAAGTLRLELTGTGQERPVLTDPVALEVILLNLLDNAVKYSGGRVDVRLVLRQEQARLAIEVADRGMGIPRHLLGKLFRRFGRLNRTVRGTGLGLYVVYSLVRRLGGRISVESQGESRGATFRVEIPCAAASTAPVEAPA